MKPPWPHGTRVRVDPRMGLDWTPSKLRKDAGRIGTVVRHSGPLVHLTADADPERDGFYEYIVSFGERDRRQFREDFLRPLSAVEQLGELVGEP